MKYILFIAIVLSGFSANAQRQKNNISKYRILESEIRYFIDSAKHTSVKNGQYNIYYASIFYFSNYTVDICISMSYIMNSSDLSRIEGTLFLNLGEDFVILSKGSNVSHLNNDNIQRIDSGWRRKFSEKLYPAAKGAITGTPRGYICCINCNKINRKFYRDADDMPSQFSLFDFPENADIKQISIPK
jgi:hypothetical protein